MKVLPLCASGSLATSMTAVATSDEVGGASMLRTKSARGIFRDAARSLSPHVCRARCPGSCAAPVPRLSCRAQAVRFLLRVAGQEQWSAFRPGVSARVRRAGESSTARDEDDACAGGQWPCKGLLEEVERDPHIGFPVDGEFRPAELMQRCRGRKGACAHDQDIGEQGSEYPGGCSFRRRIESQCLDAGDILRQLPERARLSRNREHTGSAMADGICRDAPSNTSAPANHGDVLAGQERHVPSPRVGCVRRHAGSAPPGDA